jgi:hypothetical protein
MRGSGSSLGLVVWLGVGIACTSTPATATASSVGSVAGGTVAVTATARPDTFEVQAELQGLYDEATQVMVRSMTKADVDLFHDVFCTADWVFVDLAGRTKTWADVRDHPIQPPSGPPSDSTIQRIERLALVADGATTLVRETTTRTVEDAEGRYGRRGASHTLTETTLYRDRWVRVSDKWKLKSRTQLSAAKVSVDKPEWSLWSL